MKIMPFTSLMRSILVVVVSACSDDIPVSGQQRVYFEMNYANQAWGSQFKGFLIDEEGRILTYDKPAKWNDAGVAVRLTAEEMEANLAQTTMAGPQIVPADLERYAAEARQVSDSAFSKPLYGGADQGATRFYSYRYDAATMTYSAVLLRQIGNVTIHNTDPNAEHIADWLIKVVEDVY